MSGTDDWGPYWLPKHVRGYVKRYPHKATCTMVNQMVQQDGNNLQFVPEHLMTWDVCGLAVHQTGWANLYIPKHYQNKDFYRYLVLRSGAGRLIQIVPQSIKTLDFLIDVVNVNNDIVRFLPRHCTSNEHVEIWKAMIAITHEAIHQIYQPPNDLILIHKMIWEV